MSGPAENKAGENVARRSWQVTKGVCNPKSCVLLILCVTDLKVTW